MFDKNTENEKEEKSGKHGSTAKERYEKRNPNWTVCMPQEWHDEFKTLAESVGLSRREFMAVVLDKIMIDFENARVQGYKEGSHIGHTKGYKEGYQHGEAAGYEKGLQEGLEKGEKIGYEKGEIAGYEKGKKDGRLWCFCWICGESIPIDPKSDVHWEIMDFMRMRRFCHSECLDRLNRERFYHGFY